MSSLTDNPCASFGSELAGILSDKARATDILRAVLNAGWRLDFVRSEGTSVPRYVATATVGHREAIIMSDDRMDRLLCMIAERIRTTENSPQAILGLAGRYRHMAKDAPLLDREALVAAADACEKASDAMAMVADRFEETEQPRILAVDISITPKTPAFILSYRLPIRASWSMPVDKGAFDDGPVPDEPDPSRNWCSATDALEWGEKNKDRLFWLAVKCKSGTDMRLVCHGEGWQIKETAKSSRDEGCLTTLYRGDKGIFNDPGYAGTFEKDEAARVVIDILRERVASQESEDDGSTAEDDPQALLGAEKKYRQLADEAEGRGDLVAADKLDHAANTCKVAAEATIAADKSSADAQTLKIIEKQRAVRRADNNGFDLNDYEDKDIFGSVQACAPQGGDLFYILYHSSIRPSEPRWWGAPPTEEDVDKFYPPNDDISFPNEEEALAWADKWRNEMLWHVIKEESGTKMVLEFHYGTYVLRETVPSGRLTNVKRQYRGKTKVSDNIDSVDPFSNRKDATRHAIDIVNKRKASQHQ